jgi:hypothetical protein
LRQRGGNSQSTFCVILAKKEKTMTANSLDFLLQQAQKLSASELSALVQALQKLQNEQPVNMRSAASQRMPRFGCAKGKIKMAEDFDAPLDDFKDYYPE